MSATALVEAMAAGARPFPVIKSQTYTANIISQAELLDRTCLSQHSQHPTRAASSKATGERSDLFPVAASPRGIQQACKMTKEEVEAQQEVVSGLLGP